MGKTWQSDNKQCQPPYNRHLAQTARHSCCSKIVSPNMGLEWLNLTVNRAEKLLPLSLGL